MYSVSYRCMQEYKNEYGYSVQKPMIIDKSRFKGLLRVILCLGAL